MHTTCTSSENPLPSVDCTHKYHTASGNQLDLRWFAICVIFQTYHSLPQMLFTDTTNKGCHHICIVIFRTDERHYQANVNLATAPTVAMLALTPKVNEGVSSKNTKLGLASREQRLGICDTVVRGAVNTLKETLLFGCGQYPLLAA